MPRAPQTPSYFAAVLRRQAEKQGSMLLDATHPAVIPVPKVTRSERERLRDEARHSHYQDQPFSTAALTGGVAGAILPALMSTLYHGGSNTWQDFKADPGRMATVSALGGGAGALLGTAAEAASRGFVRAAGPAFDKRKWHRDQDPHRWNGALRLLPLMATSMAARVAAKEMFRNGIGAKQATTTENLRAAVRRAEAEVTVPSLKQIETGNYRKGHVMLHSLDITFETASGQSRKGVDPNGKAWSVTLQDPYGYIKGTDSAEPSDQMDVFVGPYPENELVFVVDQNKHDGKTFDEHKVVMGVRNSREAKDLYTRNYSAGWKGFRSVTPLTIPQFKSWLKNGDVTQPLAGQQFSDFHKTAFDWKQLGQNIRQQMPGFHGWDTAIGAALGGGAGYLGSAFSSDRGTRRNRWRNALLAALGGGATANLVGDRARRYISNIPGAFGYDINSMVEPARRAGLKGVWEGAILDKPIAPAPSDQGWDPDHPGEWAPQGLPRRELLRRALGVHAPTDKDFFVNVGSAVHHGRMHDKIELNRQFFDPEDSGKLNANGQELFKHVVDPSDWAVMHKTLKEKGKSYRGNATELFDGRSIFSNIFGSLPITNVGDAHRARDVWDFDWSDTDTDKFKDIVRGAWKDPKSLWNDPVSSADVDQLLRVTNSKVVHNTDVLKSLLARRVLNDVLLKRAPVFEQDFTGSYDPKSNSSIPNLELFRSTPLPLPDDELIGKGVAVGAGALGAGGLIDWATHRSDRSKQKSKPQVQHPAYA